MKLKQKIAIGYVRAKFKIFSILSKKLAARKAFDLFCTPFVRYAGKPAAIFEKAEPLYFTLNGLKVNGYRWNNPQQHKVLILHGFSSAASKFHQYVSPLVAKGYEVLAFDAPAHGTSEGKMINAVQYCEMIEEVIRMFGPFKGFVAHSFGGMALSLALEKMHHTEDTRIVFIAPATETSTAIDAAFDLLHLGDRSIRKEFDNIIFEKSGQRPEWFSIRRAMKNIKAAVLWLHDEEDDITPVTDVLKVQQENFPNIDFVFTRGLGHRKIYKDVDIKSKVVQFL